MPQSAPSQITKSNGSNAAPIGSLVDILVSQGVLKPEQAQSIKTQELQTTKPQEALLLESSLVSEEQLTQAKATFYNVPFVNLEQSPISPEALAVLPQTVAERFKV